MGWRAETAVVHAKKRQAVRLSALGTEAVIARLSLTCQNNNNI